jgi:hypothetical protein
MFAISTMAHTTMTDYDDDDVCSMPCNGSVYLKWYGISHCYEVVLVA